MYLEEAADNARTFQAAPGLSVKLPEEFMRKALDEMEAKLRAEKGKKCDKVRVLQFLEGRNPLLPRRTPAERVARLTLKYISISGLVTGHRLLRQLVERFRKKQLSRTEFGASLQGLLRATPELLLFEIPEGYVMGTEEQERQRVLCELASILADYFLFVRTGAVPGQFVGKNP